MLEGGRGDMYSRFTESDTGGELGWGGAGSWVNGSQGHTCFQCGSRESRWTLPSSCENGEARSLECGGATPGCGRRPHQDPDPVPLSHSPRTLVNSQHLLAQHLNFFFFFKENSFLQNFLRETFFFFFYLKMFLSLI